MALTLAQLLAGKTLAQQRQALFDGLAAANFPVTSWRDGDVARTLVEIDAQALFELAGSHADGSLIAQIAAGGLLGVAADEWLRLLARELYDLPANEAIATQGTVVLTAGATAGPYTVFPGQLWFATATGLRYRSINAANVTVPQGGSVSIPVQAEAAGVAYNVANGAITVLLTPLAGVTCSNPDPGSGTWITRPGVEAESDPALKSRCRARWPALGSGAPSASYDLWARTAAATITRTRVVASASVGGQVDVYVAGPTGAVPGGDVAAAQAYIEARAPLTSVPVVSSASALAVTVTGTLFGLAQFQVGALAAAQAALEALIASVPIGGTIYRAALFEALMSPTGVENVTLTAPASDTALTISQVATLTANLAWTNL